MLSICHIYLQHSSVFISLQLLYQQKQNCSNRAVSSKTWRAVTERESGGLPERHLCVENGGNELGYVLHRK